MSDSDSDAVSEFEPPAPSMPVNGAATRKGAAWNGASNGHVGTSRDGARYEAESASSEEETELNGHGADEAAGTQEAGQESAAEDEEPVPRPTNGRARANGENGHARRHTDQVPHQETAQDHARQLKNRLRAIEEKSHAMGIGRANLQALDELVKEISAITAEAGGSDPAIAAIATRIVRQLTMTVKNAGRATKAEANSFDVAEFLDPLKRLLGHDLPVADAAGEHLQDELDELEVENGDRVGKRKYGVLGNWDLIGWKAVKRVRRVIGGEFMNGMMAVEHKARVINRRQRRQDDRGLAQEAQAVELKQTDAPKEDETIGLSRKLTKQLATLTRDGEESAINLFEWFINPRDFGQSVENLFLTSFIVREAGAAIIFKHGVPFIFACEPPSGQDLANSVFKKRQVVMELTEQVWRDAIELFKIRESIIPHREKPAELVAEEARRARLGVADGVGAGLPQGAAGA